MCVQGPDTLSNQFADISSELLFVYFTYLYYGSPIHKQMR